jgi:hypothetical protein
MISTTSAKTRTNPERIGEDGLPTSEVPGAATATAALEGGKKLLGQLMGSINLGANGISTSSQELPALKDVAEGVAVTHNGHDRRSTSKTRFDRNQSDYNESLRPVPTRGVSEQSGQKPRRTSFASDTASEEVSRSASSATTRGRPYDEPLGGLGFGQVLEGMVDPGEWTRRWGEVMSNPQYVDRFW